MVKKLPGQYQFIDYRQGCVWPYFPNEEMIGEISSSREWAPVAAELSDFLLCGNELNLGMDTLLMRMKGTYVITNDTVHPEKIHHRAKCRYRLVDDLFDEHGNYRLGKRTIGVQQVFDTFDVVLKVLRKKWGLGYERRVIDLWDKQRVVVIRPGFYG